jgi:hypothetical protein
MTAGAAFWRHLRTGPNVAASLISNGSTNSFLNWKTRRTQARMRMTARDAFASNADRTLTVIQQVGPDKYHVVEIVQRQYAFTPRNGIFADHLVVVDNLVSRSVFFSCYGN